MPLVFFETSGWCSLFQSSNLEYLKPENLFNEILNNSLESWLLCLHDFALGDVIYIYICTYVNKK